MKTLIVYENSKNVQYKTEYQIIPEIVDKNGNVIGQVEI